MLSTLIQCTFLKLLLGRTLLTFPSHLPITCPTPPHRHTTSTAPLLSHTALPTPLPPSRMMEDRCTVTGLPDNRTTDSTPANGILTAQQGPVLECVIL